MAYPVIHWSNLLKFYTRGFFLKLPRIVKQYQHHFSFVKRPTGALHIITSGNGTITNGATTPSNPQPPSSPGLRVSWHPRDSCRRRLCERSEGLLGTTRPPTATWLQDIQAWTVLWLFRHAISKGNRKTSLTPLKTKKNIHFWHPFFTLAGLNWQNLLFGHWQNCLVTLLPCHSSLFLLTNQSKTNSPLIILSYQDSFYIVL